jgi:hypothetical protein
VRNFVNDPDLSIYATKNSPTLTGVPRAPTAAYGNNSTQIATTAFVQGEKLSPAFTGTPTAPTAPSGTANTQIATTAFVGNAINNIDLSLYATKNSPILTGIPQAPTAAAGTSTTQIATTAFVQTAIGSGLWQGAAKYVTTADPDPAQGSNGDFWFKYQP